MSDFKLENVLNYRKHMEDLLLFELSQKEAALSLEISCCMEKEKEKEKLGRQMEEQMERGLKTNQCSLFLMALQRMESSINSHKNNILKLKNEIKIHQQKTIVASKERKILEILKEKHISYRHVEVERAEMNNLDEFSTNQYLRKMEIN